MNFKSKNNKKRSRCYKSKYGKVEFLARGIKHSYTSTQKNRRKSVGKRSMSHLQSGNFIDDIC